MPECSFESITEETGLGISPDPINEWLEQDLWNFRRWHVILMFCTGFLSVVICVCCCCRFRIPRTKQEIEADYIRKKLTRKFRKQLKFIQNGEMDEMDLKKALDRIREEFKSDTESIAHSEIFSVGSVSRSRPGSPTQFYRKPSIIGVDIENLIELNENGLMRSSFSRWMDSIKVKNRNRKSISVNV